MSNGNDASETVKLGLATAHSDCKIVPYEDIEKVEMKCWLEQDLGNGYQPVNQFYDPTRPGIFKAKVCLYGGLRKHLCGKLCLCAHVECVGPGDPDPLPCMKIELDPCKDVDQEYTCYDLAVPIPPNYLSAGECGRFCCFVGTLTSLTPCYPPESGHICCYCKGPCVMVCNPPHV